MLFFLLLNTKLLHQHQNEIIDLLWIFKGLGYSLFLQAPLTVSNHLRTLGLYVEVSDGLIGIKPGIERNKCYINVADGLAPKVRLVSELSFHQLEAVNEVLLGCLLFFSFFRPYLPPKVIYLQIHTITQR